jgi:hypothetical protein
MSLAAPDYGHGHRATTQNAALERQPAPPSDHDWAIHQGPEAPGYPALRSALRAWVRGGDVRLSVHKARPQLRVRKGRNHADVLVYPGQPVMLELVCGFTMQLAHPAPAPNEDLDRWAAALARFIVRRLEQ